MSNFGQWKTTAGENIAYGSSTSDEVIMQLVIDDGVPSRGHRVNIFSDAFGTTGIATGPHVKHTPMSVLTYAGSYISMQ